MCSPWRSETTWDIMSSCKLSCITCRLSSVRPPSVMHVPSPGVHWRFAPLHCLGFLCCLLIPDCHSLQHVLHCVIHHMNRVSRMQ